MSSLTTQPASNQPMLPSEIVEPQRVNTPPQQGSTQPDDGHHAHPNRTDDDVIMPAARDESRVAQEGAAAQEGGRPPKFAEQVIGYAQKTRGAMLGKESLKEHGQQILQGQADAREEVPKA